MIHGRLWLLGFAAAVLVVGGPSNAEPFPQQQSRSGGPKPAVLLSGEFKAAATEAFGKLEALRATVCLPYDSAWESLEPLAKAAVEKAAKLARTKAERALGDPLPATETEGAPAGLLASYHFRLLASRALLARSMLAGRTTWTFCKVDVTMYEEDRPAIMKALDLTEKAAADLAGKVPAPTAKEISEVQEELDEFSKLLDRAIGMFKRAAAVARRIETWYEVDPDHPDAQALVAEWCGNLNGLTQKIHEVHEIANEDAVKTAIAMPGDEFTGEVEDITTKEREFASLLKTVGSEQHRLEGMGCTCK